MMNIAMKPTAKCSAVVPRMSPPHSVAIQLKIFTPVGTAINIVVPANTESAIGPSPTENMWWLHTPHPMNPINTPLFGYTVVVYSGVLIGFMGWGVWSHHMFSVGLGPIADSVFSATTMLIAVPTGVKIFNWLATL